MAQLTAKTVEDVLRWIETTPHHFASAEDPGFIVLKGHGDVLRIPETIRVATLRLVEPGGRFDTRMYRATKAGRARLRRAAKAKGGS